MKDVPGIVSGLRRLAAELEEADEHVAHRWEPGAWGPCVNRDPSGHDISGRYANCRCGAMCFVGERESTGETVAVLWPVVDGRCGEAVDVPAEALR